MNDYRSYKGVDFLPVFLMHYGVGADDNPPGRGSGRYPKGSGKNPNQHDDLHNRMNTKNMEDVHYYVDIPDNAKKLHPVEKLSDMKRIKANSNISVIRHNINHPNDDLRGVGRSYNCPNCSVAFDMTERGYDVIARPKPNGSNVENIEDFFKGGKLAATGVNDYGSDTSEAFKEMKTAYNVWESKRKSAFSNAYYNRYIKALKKFYKLKEKDYDAARSNTLNAIKSQGDGARGIIVVGWNTSDNINERTTCFHAFNYKVEDEKANFYDVQSSRDYKQNGEMSYGFFNEVDPRDIYIMRTDNLELSDNVGNAVYSNQSKRRSA